MSALPLCFLFPAALLDLLSKALTLCHKNLEMHPAKGLAFLLLIAFFLEKPPDIQPVSQSASQPVSHFSAATAFHLRLGIEILALARARNGSRVATKLIKLRPALDKRTLLHAIGVQEQR